MPRSKFEVKGMTKAYVTLMVHKPSGVWKKHWFDVSYAVPSLGHAGGTPFQSSKDIPKQVDKAKQEILRLCRGTLEVPEIEIIRVKEDPLLPFHDEEEGEVEWAKIFTKQK